MTADTTDTRTDTPDPQDVELDRWADDGGA